MMASKILFMGTLIVACWSQTCLASPQADYMLHCQGCHLPDGSGFVDKVPSFSGVGDFLTVKGGRDFLVQVPGTSQSVLSDAKTARVLNWILVNLSHDSLPSDFVPYTGKEVSKLRSVRLEDVSSVRAELVTRIKAKQLSLSH
jgi:hypothetical protein